MILWVTFVDNFVGDFVGDGNHLGKRMMGDATLAFQTPSITTFTFWELNKSYDRMRGDEAILATWSTLGQTTSTSSLPFHPGDNKPPTYR